MVRVADAERAARGPEPKALPALEGAVPVASSPDDFAVTLQPELARWKKNRRCRRIEADEGRPGPAWSFSPPWRPKRV